MEKNKVGRPIKFNDINEFKQIIDKYFDECDETETGYSVEGLAVSLDTCRKTILNIEKDEDRPEFLHAIKKAKARINSNLIDRASKGKTNVTMAIFLLKNNYKYRDEQETNINISKIKANFGDE